jgi:DNA-binding NarL/FixJ family response regulator
LSSTFIRIFIVDDHKLFREGIELLLSSVEDVKVVGSFGTIRESLSALNEVRPDLILLDVHLPDGKGFSFHEKAVELYGEENLKVIYLTGDYGISHIYSAMRLEAMAYLDKTTGISQLLDAIRRADQGVRTLAPDLLKKFSRHGDISSDSIELSTRESEILNGLAMGLTTSELSELLNIAVPTIRTYMSRLYGKLGAANRAQAISKGFVQGLIKFEILNPRESKNRDTWELM